MANQLRDMLLGAFANYVNTPEVILYLMLGIANVLFLFDLYVDWRQHKIISQPKRPKELSKLCSEEEYSKSREYSIDRSFVSLFEKIYNHIISCITLAWAIRVVWDMSGNFMTSRLGLSADSEIIRSVLYQIAFFTFSTVQSIPFSVYRTFWVEKRHGFNKTTLRTFVADQVKWFLLGSVMMGLISAALIWIIKRTGNYFVVATCGFSLVFQMVMVVIFPTIIQPLFNKFTPLEDGELKEKISALTKRIKFPLQKIFVIDGSTRTSHSNAYFFGLFKNKRIVLFDTLLDQMTSEEVTAIVGHELGHWACNHMLRGLILSQFNILWIFSLFGLVMNYGPLYAAIGLNDRPLVIGMILFFHLIAPLNTVVGFFMTYYSRCREFEADRYAVDLGYGSVLPSALIKLYKENKSLVHPDWLYSMMHYSHPPPSERIEAMNAHSIKSAKKAK